MKVLVYTAVSGNRDKPRNDILCFTDYKKFQEPVLNAKVYKVLPHLMAPGYDVYIWVDANIWLKHPPEYYIKKYLKDSDIALIKHPFRETVHEELEELRTKGYYRKIPEIETQVPFYEKQGFNDDRLYECNVIIRRNTEKVNAVFESWWAHITAFQYRDQISMPYVLQQLPDVSVSVIDPSARTNPDFIYRKHQENKPEVSVVIVTYGKWPITKQCLDSLFAADIKVPYEVIVVDNGSKDETIDELKRYPGITTYFNPPSHFSKGCNIGAKASKGEFILFLNNDTIIKDDFMSPMVDNFEDEKIGIVGAKCVYPDGTVQHCGIAVKNNHSIKHIFQGYPDEAAETNQKRKYQAVTAACMMIRRSVFNELGGYCEKYRTGWEDIDLCFRAGQAGHLVQYEPDARIIHIGHQSEGRGAFNKENKALHKKRWKGKLKSDIEEIVSELEEIAGSMKINIVTEPKPGWVLRRIATEYQTRMPGAYITDMKPDGNARVNLYINYALMKEKTEGVDIAWFTHKESEAFDRVAEMADVCVAMCDKTAALLPPEKTVVIKPCASKKFLKGNIVFGCVGRDYGSNRKQFDLIEELNTIEGAEVIFSNGKYKWRHMGRFYDKMDYLLVLSKNEGGPMPVLEAIAMGIPVIAPDVGWCWNYPVLKYSTHDELVTIIHGLVTSSNGWAVSAKAMMDLITQTAKSK